MRDWVETVVFPEYEESIPAPVAVRAQVPAVVPAPARVAAPVVEAQMMTSREIAELTGKRYGDVIRDIRNMLDALAKTDDAVLRHVVTEADARGYTTAIHLPKDLTITLVSGYSVVMRHRIVTRWQQLEAQAANPLAPALPNFNNPAEAARA